jgi:energy-coupling factor transporter ATP-binding protein EcfA2
MNILVGPNNCGKSTVIGAFRVLEMALRQAFHKQASVVDGPGGSERFGYYIREESIPISLENIHTDYSETDTTVDFRLSNRNRLILYFPPAGGCLLLTEVPGKSIRMPGEFRKAFPIKIVIVPVLGPVEQNETILAEETVRNGMATHKASRHFRNYWCYFEDGFEEFAALVSKTWPGMEIERPKRRAAMSSELDMFCLENRIPRELAWAGFGFQIWCQLLTHISRSSGASLLIVDEPEVYLHPDVQRQLLGILRYCGPDIFIASHSTEIMSEADASEILLIDKSKRSAERLKDVKGIQAALDAVGSVQNITLTQLARTRRLLFIEGQDDFNILRRFAQQLGYISLASGVHLTPIESGGFTAWERIRSLAWGFQSALGSEINVAAVFDRDYWSNEEIESILEDMSKHLSLAHIHSRKEIENYLLVPRVLDRALIKAIKERGRRNGTEFVAPEPVETILDRITIPLKDTTQAQYIAKRTEFLKHTKRDNATIVAETISDFNFKWDKIDSRMEVVPGKEVLRALRSEIQCSYSVNLSDFKIIDEFRKEDIPKDIRDLLERLDNYRIA